MQRYVADLELARHAAETLPLRPPPPLRRPPSEALASMERQAAALMLPERRNGCGRRWTDLR